MNRGKLTRYIFIGAAVVTAAVFVSGFDGCSKKPAGGPGAGGGQSSETTAKPKPSDQETTVQPMPGKMFVTLYFSDSNAEKLVAEKREIPKTPAIARAIIEQLSKGPQQPGLYPTVPHQVKVRSVKIQGTNAVVDLSNVRAAGFGGTSAESMLVYSIVDSLTELPNVKSVRFLVNGKKQDVLIDAFDISEPVDRQFSPRIVK